jgi:flagellar hook protein FlgE
MSFSQALSGLNAQQQSLGAIGNNIANSQTVGFKSSSVLFADVYANSKIGLGTQVAGVQQNFNAGNIEATSRNLDLAIGGDGFFRFQQPNGEIVYSRNGQLTMTAAGDLVNAQGAQIMGYAADENGTVQAGGAPVPLSVPADDLPAQATSQVDIGMNLNAGNTVIDRTAVTFDVGNPASYSYATNATVYDSLGNARNMTLYFTKVGEAGGGSWEVQAKLAGVEDPVEVTANGLTFDTSGRLSGADNFDVTFAGLAGAADLTFNLDLSGATQFANTSTVNSLVQDGYTSGSLVGITIENDGTVMRRYSNEQSLAAGQIVLANFRNPEGLTPIGDNAWVATATSGQELVGAPGTGLLGSLQSGALEASNVDMSRELVDMIIAQRAYQANSQTIKTQDEILQTAINLR